jgi:hypothetical protein
MDNGTEPFTVLLNILPEPEFPVKPDDSNTTYLGDGVYATLDPGGANGLIVWTDRADGRHWMGMDIHAIGRLYEYATKSGMLK